MTFDELRTYIQNRKVEIFEHRKYFERNVPKSQQEDVLQAALGSSRLRRELAEEAALSRVEDIMSENGSEEFLLDRVRSRCLLKVKSFIFEDAPSEFSRDYARTMSEIHSKIT